MLYIVNNEMHVHIYLPWSSSIGRYKIVHTNLPISLDYIPAKWGVHCIAPGTVQHVVRIVLALF